MVVLRFLIEDGSEISDNVPLSLDQSSSRFHFLLWCSVWVRTVLGVPVADSGVQVVQEQEQEMCSLQPSPSLFLFFKLECKYVCCVQCNALVYVVRCDCL